jgi:hypothetical protein
VNLLRHRVTDVTQRIVENEYARKLLISFIESQELPFTANISAGGHRSIRQNRLQRLWMNEIAEQMPEETAEGWRGFCKLHFGVPILRDADEKFRAEYDRVIKPLPYEQKIACMMVPIDLPVTSRMNTRQKTQYLDAVHRHFAERGVALTIPVDAGLSALPPAPPVEVYEEVP